MTNIYAVYGAANKGKTTTLGMIRKNLKEKYPSFTERIRYEEDWGDFSVILDNINGKKIGIESEGETENLVESLKYFISEKCDIIFCASRTRGFSMNCIKSYENGNDVEYIKKEYCDDEKKQKSVNEKQAKDIISFAEL